MNVGGGNKFVFTPFYNFIMGCTTVALWCPVYECDFHTWFGPAALNAHLAGCLLKHRVWCCAMPECTRVIDPSKLYCYHCGHGFFCVEHLFYKDEEGSTGDKLVLEMEGGEHRKPVIRLSMCKCPLCRDSRGLIKIQPDCFKAKKMILEKVNTILDTEQADFLESGKMLRNLNLSANQKAELSSTLETEKEEKEKKFLQNNARVSRMMCRAAEKELIVRGFEFEFVKLRCFVMFLGLLCVDLAENWVFLCIFGVVLVKIGVFVIVYFYV